MTSTQLLLTNDYYNIESEQGQGKTYHIRVLHFHRSINEGGYFLIFSIKSKKKCENPWFY